MKTKIFTKNEKGKIEFTESELKTLLDEIYNEGYHDGKNRSYIYTTPDVSKPWWQYGTWTTTTSKTGSSTFTIKGDK